MSRKKKREDAEAAATAEAAGFADAPATPAPHVKRITPIDIQEKAFKSAVRGYNEHEVDQFLDEVTEELARLLAEGRSLREQLERAEMRPTTRLGSEGEPSTFLVEDARAEAARVLSQAREEAARLVAAARGEASAMLDVAAGEAGRVRAGSRHGGGSSPEGEGASPSVVAPGGKTPSRDFIHREREFLQSMAGLIQEHAEAIREDLKRVRGEPGDEGPEGSARGAPDEAAQSVSPAPSVEQPAPATESGPGPGPDVAPDTGAGPPSAGLLQAGPAPEASGAEAVGSTDLPDGEGATLVALGSASGSVDEGPAPDPEPGPVEAPSAESVWGPGDTGSDEPAEGPVWFSDDAGGQAESAPQGQGEDAGVVDLASEEDDGEGAVLMAASPAPAQEAESAPAIGQEPPHDEVTGDEGIVLGFEPRQPEGDEPPWSIWAEPDAPPSTQSHQEPPPPFEAGAERTADAEAQAEAPLHEADSFAEGQPDEIPPQAQAQAQAQAEEAAQQPVPAWLDRGSSNQLAAGESPSARNGAGASAGRADERPGSEPDRPDPESERERRSLRELFWGED